MFAHVDEAEGPAGSVQRPLHHGLWGPHKGVDGPVGGGPRVDVQQAAAGGLRDGGGDGIDHLSRGRGAAEPKRTSVYSQDRVKGRYD